MRSYTQTVREGENMGPVDWSHATAVDKPALWREAERDPDKFSYEGWPLLALCMYDGWPYWTPRPAIQYVGPLGSAEWAFFDSYGVNPSSVFRKGPKGHLGIWWTRADEPVA